MTRTLLLIASLCLLMGPSLSAQEAGIDFHTDQLVIELSPKGYALFQSAGIDSPELQQAFAAAGVAEAHQRFPFALPPDPREPEQVNILDQLEAKLLPGVNYQRAIATLNASELINYAEPLTIERLFAPYYPNDYDSAAMWNLHRMDAFFGWGVNRGDSNIVIAVIDAGIKYDHPDLIGNVVVNAADPIDNIDNDGNGFVDDYYGWDFGGDGLPLVQDNDPRPPAAANAPQSLYHGTEVTGFAVMQQDNGIGSAGSGGLSRLLPISIANDSLGVLVNGYQAIVYAANRGADVMNLSWGSGAFSSANQEVIDYAVINRDAAVVAAGGNGPTGAIQYLYPASFKGVTAVSILRRNGQLTGSCNCDIDVSAPGSGPTTSINDNYINLGLFFSSWSSPQVAGALGVVRAHFPNYNARQAMEQLRVTADRDVYQQAGNSQWEGLYGTGVVNLFRALTVQSPSIRMDNYTTIDGNNGILQSGDTVELAGTFRNLLQPTSNLQITMQPTGSSVDHVSMLSPTVLVGQINTLSSQSNNANPFRFVVNNNVPENTVLTFRIRYVDGIYDDQQCFTMVVNPTYTDVNTASINTSVNNIGNIGYNDYPNNNQGQGFLVNESQQLFEAGVIMALNHNQTSDNLRLQLGLGSKSNDFVALSQLEINPPGQRTDTEVFANYHDAVSPNPIQVEVRDETYATEDAPNDPFIIKRFILTNNEPLIIDSLHFGMASDWDVGSEPGDDSAAWNAAEELLYAWGDVDQSSNVYVGLKIIEAPGNRHAWSQEVTAFGYSDSAKYAAISSGTDSAPAAGGDLMQALGIGPLEMLPFQSDTIVLALVHGSTEAELIANAQQAVQHYNCLFKSNRLAMELGPDQTACTSLDIDGTTPDAVSYEWNDGVTQPARSITSSGIYELTAFNAEGCAYSDELSVQILPAPEAGATFSDTIIGVGQAPVFFSEDAINATSFTWHTGDGYGFMGANFSHVYQDTGSYVAQLIASNGVCSDTLEQTILVVPASGLQEPSLSAVRVYPNPVRDELQIELPGGGPYTLRLFNTLGSVIATDQQPLLRQNHTRQLDMSSLSAGVYWLEVRTDDARSMFKLIKQ